MKAGYREQGTGNRASGEPRLVLFPSPVFRFLRFLVLLFLAGSAFAQNATTVVAAARSQVGVTLHYDPSYVRIPFPMGDVPMERGVCADVIVRAFRADGVDLQALIHEDMHKNFSAYPHVWGLRGPDSNIDHRRVPNLETYFRRRGMAMPITAVVLAIALATL